MNITTYQIFSQHGTSHYLNCFEICPSLRSASRVIRKIIIPFILRSCAVTEPKLRNTKLSTNTSKLCGKVYPASFSLGDS